MRYWIVVFACLWISGCDSSSIDVDETPQNESANNSSETDAVEGEEQETDNSDTDVDSEEQGTDNSDTDVDSEEQETGNGDTDVDSEEQGTDNSDADVDSEEQGTGNGDTDVDSEEQGTGSGDPDVDSEEQGAGSGDPDVDSEEQETSTEIDYSLVRCEDDLSDVLALVNEKRMQTQTCGSDTFPPVGEVVLNRSLILAAETHSANMANYNFFDHTGLDSSTVGTRVTAQGYTWSYVSENIAAGQKSAQSAIDGWMSSEGHCRNIMNSKVTDMGLACVSNSASNYNYYWTQVFAKPR